MSLMDDFNAGKLYGWYFCKVLIDNKNHVCPVFVSKNENDFKIGEVLSPCDYDLFVELTEKVKELEKEVAKGDEIIGKLLNEGHAAIEKNKQFSSLLKECAEYIEGDIEFREDEDAMYCRDILTRINAAINGNERPDNG